MLSNFKKYSSNPFVGAMIVFGVAFILFIPSLQNKFVWDDVVNVKGEWSEYQAFGFREIRNAFDIRSKKFYYRPLHRISYAIDYTLWGEDPFGFHLTNVFLYALCSLLVYLLALAMLSDYDIRAREHIALFSGLYFAVHPVHVESVSWVSGRTDMLATLFLLAAFLFHIKAGKNVYFFPFAVFAFILSLFSKELAVCFPFVVLAYDLIRDKKFLKVTIGRSFVYLVLFFLYVYMYMHKEGVISSRAASGSFGEDVSLFFDSVDFFFVIKTMLGAYLFYLYKLVFPFSYDSFIAEVPSSTIVAFLSVLIFIFILFVFIEGFKRKKPLLSFLVIFVVFTLAPSVLVSVLRVGVTPLAERYLFLPVGGWAILVVYMIGNILVIRSFKKSFIFFVFLLFFFVHAWVTFDRQYVWRDRASFWAEASLDGGNHPVPLLNYGTALLDEDEVDRAMEKFKEVLQMTTSQDYKWRGEAAYGMGICYLKKGDLISAEKWLEESISVSPKKYKALFQLALVKYQMALKKRSFEELQNAERYAKKALKINPRYSKAYLFLAELYLSYGNVSKAKDYAYKSLQYGLEKHLAIKAQRILNIQH